MKKIKKLVFSGGGIKGLSFLGSLRALEEYNIIDNIEELIGSSAGAILCYMINLGYYSEDIIEVIKGTNLEYLRDITSDNIINYFKHFGIDTGNNIIKILKIFTKKKNISELITFQEMYDKTKIKLIITGTNLTKKKTDYFHYENCPDMAILEAIRISISIPYIFNLCEYNDNKYIDGSIMMNYPITYYSNIEDTMGFLIFNNDTNQETDSIDKFTFSIINCLLKKENDMIKVNYKDYTVFIDLTVSMIKFNLTLEEKNEIFDVGYLSTIDYFKKHYKRFTFPDNILKEIKNFSFKHK